MSYEIGVSKKTKNILGTDYDFTYVGDKDGQAVFMCDTSVENYKFDDTTNVYDNSALKAKVATYGSEYFIPTVEDIANWTDTDISNLRLRRYVGLNNNSPIYNFIKATAYWTSSAFPYDADCVVSVNSYGGIDYGHLGVSDTRGVRPCFAVENTPAPSTKPKIKLGTLAKAWKAAYTPSTPSYQVGDKLTKTLTGLGNFDFTCVEVDDTDAYFICDEIVSEQVFNSDRSKGNYYAASELKAYVDGLGVEGLTIPNKPQLEKWYSSESDRIAQYNGTVAEYWTSSAYPYITFLAYCVYSDGNVRGGDVNGTLGVRPCFAISK